MEVEVISRIGSRCRHCSDVVTNKQQNGTRLAFHLYNCRSAALEVRHTNLSSLEGGEALADLPGFLQSVVDGLDSDECGDNCGTLETFSYSIDGE